MREVCLKRITMGCVITQLNPARYTSDDEDIDKLRSIRNWLKLIKVAIRESRLSAESPSQKFILTTLLILLLHMINM